MNSLKLVALDEGDLEVISAHMQDAILRTQDMAWEPRSRRFVALMNRFDWSSARQINKEEQRSKTPYERHRCALRFDYVKSIQLKNIDVGRKDLTLNLLAIRFTATDVPSGVVELIFADHCSLRLNVECIEAELNDIGPGWKVRSQPEHEG